jgi:hypothetical protein
MLRRRARSAPPMSVLMARHVLPNCLSPVIVQASFVFAAAVLTEAALSFLGVGVPPYVPSWGVILAEGRLYIQQAPWLVIYPGVAIMLTIFGLNLFGDGLRDLLDPKIRGLTSERQSQTKGVSHAATSSCVPSDRHGTPRRHRLRASAGVHGRHPDAAGRRQRGDAAVAVGAALNVVEPFMSSIGGIGLMLISRPNGERHVLDFIGGAPRAAGSRACTEDELAGGPKACAGRQPRRLADRARALRPAAARAGAGARHRAGRARRAADVQERRVLHAGARDSQRSREAERLYWPNGGPRAGAVVTYKDLAARCARWRKAAPRSSIGADREGDRARGAGGRRLAQRAGPRPSRAGVARARRIAYRGHDVVHDAAAVLGLPDAGDAEHPRGFDLRGWGHNSVDYLHHLIEAIKLGSPTGWPTRTRDAARSRAARARRTRPPSARASSQARPVQRGRALQPREAAPARSPRAIRPSSRTSRRRTSRAPTPTGRWSRSRRRSAAVRLGLRGAGHGIVLNNILKWSDRDPASTNVLRPGRKLGHDDVADARVPRRRRSCSPSARRARTASCRRQPQMLLNSARVRHERAGGDRGRACASIATVWWTPSRDLPMTCARAWPRGPPVNVLDDWSWVVGGGQGLRRDRESGAWMAGADPRRDGYALAI